ncbi:membrane protein insertase YidC [Rarobacter faecitabidus]|uniref:Membrane protein insertase YidC n=1 Tax=Rarobacter faecitabidus TaxID=13243 RepID=A0A542ZPB2_RARFA|nr:membrane protein insertase YidC [Rarobacter faecitabidus]TQL62211.1 YidC/Oxa1 family membrane protein insertase [Rarobacter faecitabidus]
MGTIMAPFEFIVSWIMYLCHLMFDFFLPNATSLAWVLSIVGLVVILRVLMIPLFFRQIKASRAQMLLQPEVKEIQKKYKGRTDPASREAMSRETMALYKKHGTHPMASCLPILIQAPFFFALFRVLQALPKIADPLIDRGSIGPIDAAVAAQAEGSTIFGAPLSSWFLQPGAAGQTKVIAAILIIAMATTQFITQRQLTLKNMPPAALEGPMAQTQKIMMYAMPLVMAISGINFPIGVLLYWTTTNLWSTGQQFYTIRKMPAPGSEAERKLNERRARRAAAKGIVIAPDTPTVIKPQGQRQQPVGKARQKSKKKKR